MVVLNTKLLSGVNGITSHCYDRRQGPSLHQRRGQLRRKHMCSESLLIRFVFISTACVVFSSIISLSFYRQSEDNHISRLREHRHVKTAPFLSPEAYPVYGMQASFHRRTSGKGKNETVSAVYAIPGFNNYYEEANSIPSETIPRIKGIVLLLHACTHNAFKFFAPSSTCPDCVGLSEEMRLARLVLERDYAAVAVTASSKGGCWGGIKDIEAIKTVLGEFRAHWLRHTRRDTLEIDDPPTVYALGASSGGTMAAELVAEGVAESATVMVMGLGDKVLDRISSLSPVPGRKLYLAPMTRDKGTAKRVRDNFEHWNEKATETKHELLVDKVSCLPIPVTADYLWNRVPGMTLEAAQTIVRILLDHEHLDPSTRKLIVNPTTSNWRDFFLKVELPMPKTLRLSQQQQKEKNEFYKSYVDNFLQNKKSMVLWETFDLTPGISPLAKALHRAWAMHEYCSETVDHSLSFFEGKNTKQEILQVIEEQTTQESMK